jgi:hypothetical protein
MVEPPESANNALQCIGRVFRIGQKSAQNFWILTTNHTYDQVVQARAARKMYGQIAGQAGIKPQEGSVDSDANKFEEFAAFDDGDGVNRANEKVIRLYMEMFGQRSPRDQWTNVKDLCHKDSLAEPQYRGKYTLPFCLLQSTSIKYSQRSLKFRRKSQGGRR